MIHPYIAFYCNSRTFEFILGVIVLSLILLSFAYFLANQFFPLLKTKTMVTILGSIYFISICGVALTNHLNDEDSKFQYKASFQLSPFRYLETDYPFKRVETKMKKSFRKLDTYRKEKLKKKTRNLLEYNNAN